MRNSALVNLHSKIIGHPRVPAVRKTRLRKETHGTHAIRSAPKVLGVDDFGESAPGDQVFEAKGITPANLAKIAK